MIWRVVVILFSVNILSYVSCESKVAVAELSAGNINGTVYFTETDHGIHVTGTIVGLPAGLYGFHVHEIGDVTTCDAAGAHFNPEGTNHGGRDHSVRHVGDLGNIQFMGNGDAAIANINFFDNVIALRGENNILGRTLVLHEQEDDLGLGGHDNSLTTGNAGARLACGLIVEKDAGNSAVVIIPSVVMILLSVVFLYESV